MHHVYFFTIPGCDEPASFTLEKENSGKSTRTEEEMSLKIERQRAGGKGKAQGVF